MGKSKLRKKFRYEEPKKKATDTLDVPIKNLPEKFLWMHVKSGTKIRNVLGYALKEFPSHNSVVWTGIGHGIAKAISCAEIFKRKHEALHQVTKLRYVKSKKSKTEETDETCQVPEIHILLTKSIKDTTELGYQAPGDCGEFPEKEDAIKSKTNTTIEDVSHATCFDAEQFAAMGLKIGQKRPRESQAKPYTKKNKKIKS